MATKKTAAKKAPMKKPTTVKAVKKPVAKVKWMYDVDDGNITITISSH